MRGFQVQGSAHQTVSGCMLTTSNCLTSIAKGPCGEKHGKCQSQCLVERQPEHRGALECCWSSYAVSPSPACWFDVLTSFHWCYVSGYATLSNPGLLSSISCWANRFSEILIPSWDLQWSHICPGKHHSLYWWISGMSLGHRHIHWCPSQSQKY